MRAIKPKGEPGESPSNSPTTIEHQKTKRRCVSNACVPCRKRKSKCDGGTPYCSTCTAVYKTPCSYDADGDQRRKTVARRETESVKELGGAFDTIVSTIRASSDAEAVEILQQLRTEDDLDAMASKLKDLALPVQSAAQSVKGELANLVGSPTTDEGGMVKHFGQSSNLSLLSLAYRGKQEQPVSSKPETWTHVTADWVFVEHLLLLYFGWYHPFYTFFSKEAFIDDMNRGKGKFCSPLLFNAILSAACALSDRPEALADPSDPQSTGDHFYAEAKSLLDTDEDSKLTTVQALAVLSLREVGRGRDSSGYQYAGRCMRMAIEIGLHVSTDVEGTPSMDAIERDVRQITFWGCFVCDACWSLCMGRVGQLPRSAIDIDKPGADASDSESWQPYPDDQSIIRPFPACPISNKTHLRSFSLLAEIVNDLVYWFYARRDQLTSKKLTDFYRRCTKWYASLPADLDLRDATAASVLTLHMFYHTVVLQVFRPFLNVELVNSNVVPRDVCANSANAIAALTARYRQTLGSMQRSVALTGYIISSANIIDLINLPDTQAARNLVLGIAALREGSVSHGYSRRALELLKGLIQQWHINLTPELHRAFLDPMPNGSRVTSGYQQRNARGGGGGGQEAQHAHTMGAGDSAYAYDSLGIHSAGPTTATAPSSASFNPQSSPHTINNNNAAAVSNNVASSASALPPPPPSSTSTSSNAASRGHVPEYAAYYGYGDANDSGARHNASAAPAAPSAASSSGESHNNMPQGPTNLFWSPFQAAGPNSMPVHSLHPSEAVDLPNMLEVSPATWEQISQAGFRIVNSDDQPHLSRLQPYSTASANDDDPHHHQHQQQQQQQHHHHHHHHHHAAR